jgi:tRNA threonylcarbamoyl adenosine modification protein (Sua5/YciO/YrdC/YwlC family)
MAKIINIHPENPQARLIRNAVDILEQQGVIVYPTDSSYALGCHLGDKKAMERIIQIRALDHKHNFTLVGKDLAEISKYAIINNTSYRLIKSITPDAYTFIHKATKLVPKRLQNKKRKTIGFRIPNNDIALAISTELGEPILSSTLILPNETEPQTEPYEINELIGHAVDLIIDGGFCGFEATTVIDMESNEIIRQGKGKSPF